MSDEFSNGPKTEDLVDADKPPKRDGRTMTNDERIQAGMKPRGRKPGSPVTRKRVSLEGELVAYLTLGNLLFAFVPDPYKGDALDEAEITALAKAANDAAMANAELYKYLDMILRGGTGGIANLVIVIACIAGRRLARHGQIAEEWDTRLGTMVQAVTNPQAVMSMFANAEPVSIPN